jgi:TolB protein
VVEHTGEQGASYYLLDVVGAGVDDTPPAPVPAAEEPATRPPGNEAKPPARPRGRLVFQTSFGGDIYTIRAGGKGLQRLTDGTDPVWSPSGAGTGEQRIAFARWREPRGVWVVNSDGSGERRVFDWGETRWPSWSADGSRVLFSRQEGGRTEDVERCFWGFCFTFPAHPQWRLGAVNPDDGVFNDVPASKWSLAPDWSPVDSSIVYSDEHGLRIQSEDGSYTFQLTDHPMDTSPVWSPAGTGAARVAFVRRQHDHWEIYRVDADGRNLTRLTDTPRKPGGDVGHSVAPAWSPDGHFIAFLTDRTGRWEIWVMRANGSQQRPMFKTALDGLVLDYGFVADRVISWTE